MSSKNIYRPPRDVDRPCDLCRQPMIGLKQSADELCEALEKFLKAVEDQQTYETETHHAMPLTEAYPELNKGDYPLFGWFTKRCSTLLRQGGVLVLCVIVSIFASAHGANAGMAVGKKFECCGPFFTKGVLIENFSHNVESMGIGLKTFNCCSIQLLLKNRAQMHFGTGAKGGFIPLVFSRSSGRWFQGRGEIVETWNYPISHIFSWGLPEIFERNFKSRSLSVFNILDHHFVHKNIGAQLSFGVFFCPVDQITGSEPQKNRGESKNNGKGGNYGLSIRMDKVASTIPVKTKNTEEIGNTFLKLSIGGVVLIFLYAGLERFRTRDRPNK